MERPCIAIESPLKGNFSLHRAYLTWCCRYMHECGYSPLASHLVAPWFLDDRIEDERTAGFSMPWFWRKEAPHYFFTDLGMSGGMVISAKRCLEMGIAVVEDNHLPSGYWSSFQKGELPPHTPGFESVCVVSA